MDTLTHTLAAAAIWRANLAPRDAGLSSAVTLLVAANAADVEGLLRLAGAAAYIRNYHGAAHSLAGGVALALGVAALAALGLRRQPGAYAPGRRGPGQGAPPGRFRSLAATALIGAGSHLLLDVFQGYGERLLWPFSEARYGLSLMSSFDVANLAVLLLALSLPAMLNLVNAEIGAKRVNPARGALIGLVALAALVPARYSMRVRADAASAPALLEDQESHLVHPSPFLPWRWYLVQDTPIAYLAQEVDALGERVLPGIARFRKPVPNNLLIAARESESGRSFLELAAYPFFSLEEGRRGVLVRIRDMQFFIPGAGDRPYSVEVEVNSQMRVLGEHAVF